MESETVLVNVLDKAWGEYITSKVRTHKTVYKNSVCEILIDGVRLRKKQRFVRSVSGVWFRVRKNSFITFYEKTK